jgi:hypothetical protein
MGQKPKSTIRKAITLYFLWEGGSTSGQEKVARLNIIENA